MENLPELLAPAGNIDSLVAAINGGADAVYLGLKEFSARQKAGNFSIDELREALDLAHRNDVKVYVVINTLIKDSELNLLVEFLSDLVRTNVDGLIVQDPGLIWLLQNYYPQIPLQLSTQASVYGKEGARFFNDLGFSRVVLARETGIEEVKEMKEQLDTEIKIFNHGALCYAYSGQCHLSSSVGKRSGNRGFCAQPCRKYYKLSKEGKLLKEGFLLSTKDLSTLSRVDDLIESGADALKIEGRMKTPEYVYTVTKAYRDQLDGKKLENDEEIRAVFNRDFTDGRLFSNTHNLSQKNPKKRGEFIGKIVAGNKGLRIKLNKDITLINGDGLSFGEDEAVGMNVSGMRNLKGDKVSVGSDTVILNSDLKIPAKTKVYRSFNKALMDRLKKEALKEPSGKRLPLDVRVIVKKDTPVKVLLNTENETVDYISEIIPEPAQKKGLAKKTLEKAFSKLGNTSYILNNFKADLDDNLFLSMKDLNTIRREAVKRLETQEQPISLERVELNFPGKARKTVTPEISLLFDNPGQAREALEMEFDEAVIRVDHFNDLNDVRTLIRDFKDKGKKVLLTTPLVLSSQESKLLQQSEFLCLVGDSPNLADGFLVPNYELLELIKDRNVYMEADVSFNVFNQLAIIALSNWGFNKVTLSDELSQKEIRKLAQSSSLPVTLIAGGKRQLMVSANCVFDCSKCQNCRQEGFYDLENLNGDRFTLRVKDAKNYIYNANPAILGQAYKTLNTIDTFRLNLTNESKEEIKELIDNLRNGKQENPGNYKGGVI